MIDLRLVEADDSAVGDRDQLALSFAPCRARARAGPGPLPAVSAGHGAILSPDALYFRQQRFDLRQHTIDAAGKLIEVVGDVLHRQPLVYVAFHDALDALIDGFHPPLRLAAEPYAGRQDAARSPGMAPRISACATMSAKRGQNADAAAENQHPAVGQRACHGDDRCWQRACLPDLISSTSCDPAVSGRSGGNVSQVAGDQVAVGGEQRREDHVVDHPISQCSVRLRTVHRISSVDPCETVRASVDTKALMRLVSNTFVCQ